MNLRFVVPVLLLAVVTSSIFSCTRLPEPEMLEQTETVRTSSAARQAKKLAPQTFAHAERLREKARLAHRAGETDRARILAEHAIAAYNHAFVLARVAVAEQRFAEAQAELKKSDQQLLALDEQQQRLQAEAENIELKVKVARDALPLPDPEKASVDREAARREAARSLASEARLLCVSTRLLNAKADVKPELDRLTSLDAQLAKKSPPTPIAEATELRSRCLKKLTDTRRPVTQKAPAAGEPDRLLEELSEMGELFPFRDDRGVVVTLRGPFEEAGTALSESAQKTLAALARVAKQNPDFPVLVVLHSFGKADHGRELAQAEAVKQALIAAGAPKVEIELVGDALPLQNPKRRSSDDRNQRFELVFVAPSY